MNFICLKKWDIRKPTIHERKLNAHLGSVLALDWHSDGRTIASGGRDKLIKVCKRLLFYSLNLLKNLFFSY
jgi:WD40 repeat protein